MTSVKKKSLFDHIKQNTDIQNPNYWDDISDDDKKLIQIFCQRKNNG